MILLVAELEELREDLSKPAEGEIIESHLDKRKGYVATALVQKEVLALGDWVTGWSEVPDTGASFVSVDSKTEAEKITDENKSLDLTPLFSFISESADPEKKIYNLVLKADVKSSLEAVDVSLKAVKSDKVRCNVIGYDIGDITENDVKTAIATKSDIVGFRVNIEPSVVRLTEKESIKVQTFDVIYELIEAIRKNMAEQLDPEIQRTLLGKLKVLALFKKDSKSQIVGGKVLSGKAVRG